MSTKVKNKVINVSDDIIDIPGNKLLEWLLDRKKIAQHWKRSQSSLLKLINDACDQTSIEKKQYNYFECQKIFKEFEQQPNGNTKTLFGSYSNPNTQKWYEVIKAYEKDYYHIAESCQIFSNNLNYEIPALKKSIEKSMKMLDDDQKKSYEKNKNASINSFKKLCSDLGIKGEKIREEILELPLQLNEIFHEISKSIKSNNTISKSIQYYKDILNLTKVVINDTNNEPLPLLSFLNQYGNITMIEREKILNPDKFKEQCINNNNGNDSDNSGNGSIEIDWCMDIKSNEVQEQTEQPNIVWEDSNDNEKNSTIKWNDDFSMDTIEIVEESSNNFGITLEDDGNTNNSNNNNESTKNNETNKEEVYDPNETILSYRPLRNQFLDELYELDIFLNNRINEIDKSNNIVLFDMLENSAQSSSSSSLTQLELKEYSNYLNNELIQKLTNNRVKQILEIKSSKKFIDRLVLQFTQKQQLISKSIQAIKENELKIENLNILLGESKNKIDQLNKETRSLKSNLELLISNNLFDKKKINLMIPYSI